MYRCTFLYIDPFIGCNYCLEEVVKMIEMHLDEIQQKHFIRELGISSSSEENRLFSQKLENVPWSRIKLQLELLGKSDVVATIQKDTLVTKGLIHIICLSWLAKM